MNRPSPLIMGMGHPVVVVPTTLITFAVLAACLHGGTFAPLAPCLPVAAIVHRAHGQASAYREWKRSWDAMNPQPPRAPSQAGMKAAMIVGGVAGLWLLYRFGHGHHASAGQAMAALAAGVMAPPIAHSLLRWLGHRWRTRPIRPARAIPVAVARRKLSLPAPTLDRAYARLPDYCQRLLTKAQP